MRKGKRFNIKLKSGIITVGLTALAVLFAAADAAGGFLVSFPDQRTSLNRALRNIERYHPKSVKEYLEELKEVTGVNLHNTISRLKQKNLIVKSDKGYRRYALAANGISPRGIPGYGEGLVVLDSDEHDEEGHITEDLVDVRPRMIEKRMKKLLIQRK